MAIEGLDAVDVAMLRALQGDGRLTVRQLAEKVHRSPTPVFERLRRLETQGFIRKYVAIVDADKVGQGFLVFCQVKLKQINRDIAMDFVKRVSLLSEVTECYNVSGAYDYLLKVYAPSMRDYQEFVLNKLGSLDSVGAIESTFVMSEIKHDHGIPI
jgi:Lrp/AsnC family leucine-responsive transcriptional regulator